MSEQLWKQNTSFIPLTLNRLKFFFYSKEGNVNLLVNLRHPVQKYPFFKPPAAPASLPSEPTTNKFAESAMNRNLNNDDLPDGWTKKYDANGHVSYIKNVNKLTTKICG